MWPGKNKLKNESKYRVLLVAYKGIEEENELESYFISTVNRIEDLRNMNQSGDFKNSAGLTYRTSLYHSWFKETICQKLRDGYQLGLIEMRKDDSQERENIIKELDEKYGDNVLIVDEAEI